MIIQNIIFPHYGICSDYRLFFRLSNNYNYSFQNKFIFLNSGMWAHFDTYFNSFMKNKWSKYTHLNNLSIELEVKGTIRISIVNKKRELNGSVCNNIIDEMEVSCKDRSTITIPITHFENDGMYAFSLYALTDNCYFYGGRYTTNVPQEQIQDVTLGISICTFKREKYVINNIDNIKKYIFDNKECPANNHIHVLISDNANTLSKTIQNSERIHIYPNKNVGGAGGFTRCLIEILNHPEYKITHAVLMDDDVSLEPESLFRTYAFLSIVKTEYSDIFIGGSMLRLDNQSIQTECGAVWDAGKLRSLKHNLDLSTCEPCLYNDIEETCDYNAWWYCTIPMQFVTSNNLPLPIFIRGDDVEYGIRNIRHIVQLNGICVWHEPFENKYSSSMYYYIFRNKLIDNAVLHINYPLKTAIKDYYELWYREILLCRYKNSHLLSEGIRDFLKGIDWIKNTDAEVLNKEVMEKGYKLYTANELGVNYTYQQYLNSINYKPPKDSAIKQFRIRHNILRHDQNLVIKTYDPNPRYCINAKTILNYDYSSGKGFVTCYDKQLLAEEKKFYSDTVKILKQKYDQIVSEFLQRKDEITSKEFWDNYLKK